MIDASSSDRTVGVAPISSRSAQLARQFNRQRTDAHEISLGVIANDRHDLVVQLACVARKVTCDQAAAAKDKEAHREWESGVGDRGDTTCEWRRGRQMWRNRSVYRVRRRQCRHRAGRLSRHSRQPAFNTCLCTHPYIPSFPSLGLTTDRHFRRHSDPKTTLRCKRMSHE